MRKCGVVYREGRILGMRWLWVTAVPGGERQYSGFRFLGEAGKV